MTETPEQRVARLQRELADAKVEALQAQLAEAQAQGGRPGSAPAAVSFGPNATTTPEELQQLLASRGVHIVTRGGDSVHFQNQQQRDSGPVPVLAPAPRRVPGVYKLLLFPFSWWTVFTFFMVAVTPIALYIDIPISGVIAAGLTLLIVIGIRLRKDALQLSLLKWGEVAEVTRAEVLSVGTYYSGTTVQNVRMAQAHGWTVERRWYSGPVTKTSITYRVRGSEGHLMLRGLDYDNGVILADSRKPDHALCISSFPYDLHPDPSGNWVPNVRGRVVVGSILMIVFMLLWTAGMALAWGISAAHLHGIVR